MSDRLKDFIDDNREGFDDLAPGDLWAGISAAIPPASSSLLTKEGGLRSSFVKNLPAMLKYGFGASALILGTFLIITNQKEKAIANAQQVAQSDSNTEVIQAPQFNAGSVNTMTTEEKKEPLQTAQASDVQAVTPPDSIPDQPQEPVPTEKEEAAHPVAKVIVDDSLDKAASTDIDTIFRNIKRIEVHVDFCNVNVSANKEDHVSMTGRISETSGSYVVLGRRAYRKTNLRLKYAVKDTVLKVWMENEKTNEKRFTKDINTESSVLNFKVPKGTNVDVVDDSGNISASGLTNKSTHLQASFGNIKASDMSSSMVVHVSSGNIVLSRITGDIKSDNSFGHQLLEDIKGFVLLRTSSGNSTIKNLKGNADIKTSFGHQVVENVLGNIIAHVSSGNLTVKFLKGDADCRTSFGTQQFEQVVGDIIAKSSSGSIKVSDSKGKLMLGTSFGNITGKNVTLVNSADFKSSSGNIQMQLMNNMDDLSFDLKASSGSLLVEKANLKGSSSESLTLGQGTIVVRGISSFGNQVYR